MAYSGESRRRILSVKVSRALAPHFDRSAVHPSGTPALRSMRPSPSKNSHLTSESICPSYAFLKASQRNAKVAGWTPARATAHNSHFEGVTAEANVFIHQLFPCSQTADHTYEQLRPWRANPVLVMPPPLQRYAATWDVVLHRYWWVWRGIGRGRASNPG
jgi:hypothetical protein